MNESHSFPASKKFYVKGSLYPELKVPSREISLQKNPHFYVYDTSGPYTDPSVEIDIEKGLPHLRALWIKRRAAQSDGNVSQMH